MNRETYDALVAADSIMSYIRHRRGLTYNLNHDDLHDLDVAVGKCRKLTDAVRPRWPETEPRLDG